MYVVERWLARLGQSPYAEDFILKGGVLLAAFGNRRPTVDADALARNLAGGEESVAGRVKEIAAISDPDDGVEFLPETLTTRIIRDDALYSGVRVSMDARIATAIVKLRLDINFGDPVTPAPRFVDLPSLRPDGAPVRVLGYPIETVIAEKLVTAIELGPANTRVRDYADLYTLTGSHDLHATVLRAALHATATFRDSTLRPVSESVRNIAELRSETYTIYRVRLGVDGEHLPQVFEAVIDAVVQFADPLLHAEPPDGWWNSQDRRWQH